MTASPDEPAWLRIHRVGCSAARDSSGSFRGIIAANVGDTTQPGGDRHGCYDCRGGSGKRHFRGRAGEPYGTDSRAKTADTPPVRTVHRRTRPGYGGRDGGVRHGTLLGPT